MTGQHGGGNHSGQHPAAVGKRSYDRTSYILVVDDDDTLLKFFKIHLNKFFSRVIVVRNAKEAIATLKEKEIDLVLSDIRMPRMDGIQFMKKVRAFDPTIPVYLVSGALLSEEQVETVGEQADGFLRKPFTIDELHSFIDNGMKRREILKALSELVQDKKKVVDLLHGKITTKQLKDDETKAKAEELLNSLKAAS